MKIQEQRDELGRLITRTQYFGPESDGNCARERFENEKLIEYCEFRGNLKAGPRKVYAAEQPATLIEESLWQDDHCLERRDYYLNRQLKKHVKYNDGELCFEATYSEAGRETRRVTVGVYPALLFRDFHIQSQVMKSEHLSLSSSLSVVRSFHVDGSVKSEKVVLKRPEKGHGELFIERNERGDVTLVLEPEALFCLEWSERLAKGRLGEPNVR